MNIFNSLKHFVGEVLVDAYILEAIQDLEASEREASVEAIQSWILNAHDVNMPIGAIKRYIAKKEQEKL